jgi:hypothetical protein
MQRLDYTEPTIYRQQVYESSAMDAVLIRVLIPLESPVAGGILSAQEIRFNQLLGNRNLFAALSAAALIASALCAIYGIPWEPAVALLFCLLGICAVFEMKIRDAK